jgi:DNA-binding NtrC family response regulator
MNGTILAIEGDFNSRTRLYHLAMTVGVNIDFCETLGNAIGRLRFYNYSGVIIDAETGSVNIEEAIEVLKRTAGDISIAAIVSPAQARSAEKLVGRELVALMRKPIDTKSFNEAIGKLVGVSV